MQRTPHRCPRCSQPLGISWDMWGQYYVCQECGFTAEDDDALKPQRAGEPLPAPPFLTTLSEPYRLPARPGWQALRPFDAAQGRQGSGQATQRR